jgi:hypothetical protein
LGDEQMTNRVSIALLRRAAAAIATALAGVIVLATRGIEPGDKYCGRLVAPRNENVWICDQVLDQRRAGLAATGGMALVTCSAALRASLALTVDPA